jgi:hypothetical protein
MGAVDMGLGADNPQSPRGGRCVMGAALSVIWSVLSGGAVKVLDLLSHIPKKSVDTVAKYAAVFIVGWLSCYVWNGVSALRDDASAWRNLQVEQAAALPKERAREQADAVRAGAAGDKAHGAIAQGRESARADHDAGLDQLPKEKQAHARDNVLERPLFSGAARIVLDRAAGAIDPAGPSPAASAGGDHGADAAAQAAPGLAPDELYTGYLNLAEHDRVCVSRLAAAQSWMRDMLLAPPPD